MKQYLADYPPNSLRGRRSMNGSFPVLRCRRADETHGSANGVISRPIAELRAYENNARTHSDRQIEQIAESMREWGWTNPVLVDEGGMIIAGHGRVLAAELLGIENAPVMVAAGWTEAQVFVLNGRSRTRGVLYPALVPYNLAPYFKPDRLKRQLHITGTPTGEAAWVSCCRIFSRPWYRFDPSEDFSHSDLNSSIMDCTWIMDSRWRQ